MELKVSRSNNLSRFLGRNTESAEVFTEKTLFFFCVNPRLPDGQVCFRGLIM